MKSPVRVAVTGAAGQIGYALLFRIASGAMLGPDQPVILQLLEIPDEKAQKSLKGVMMELDDCAFPLLQGMIATGDPAVAFKDAHVALLVGARPRGPGMERKDLLTENAKIFTVQGEAIGKFADPNVKVLVVGNPCNTNAYIAMKTAMKHGRVKAKNFTAMLRLDHNRALAQLSAKTGKPVGAFKQMTVWGNHSPTMYPDFRFATAAGEPVTKLTGFGTADGDKWNKETFIPTVGKRGAAIIEARGLSSAASAANAAIDHMHDWWLGSKGEWTTMGVPSDGSYDIPEGMIYGFPCITEGGGVKVAKSLDEVRQLTEKMLGMTLVTHQTGPEGKTVNKVYIEAGCNIKKEYYAAILLDRTTGRSILMASAEGGVNIEEVAESHPEKIHKVTIDPAVGLQGFQARQIAFAIGMKDKVAAKAAKFFMQLYKAYEEKDCAAAEINPLVETAEGDVIALDAKMNFDSNALYRHPEVMEMRDLTEEDPTEVEASHFDLAFIKLDGNIGCLVNGAGLAMATMDIIKIHGGSPANFLDVGGGANKEKVTAAFKIILKDPNVKGIFVNIFGGIMKCDIIAEGIIAASKELGLKVPLVARLEGTNVDLGKKILAESGLNITPADDLTDGAAKIVAAVKGAR